MNYSKKGIIKKQKQQKSSSKKLALKAGVSFFRTFLVCLIMIIIVGAFAGFGALKGIIDNAPDIGPLDVIPTGYATTLYDAKGNEIQKLVGSDANRVYVTIDQIPLVVQNAFIAIEDERFWTHHGIDIKSIIRAFFQGLANGGDFDQGASTITQQLLKNQVFEGGMETTFAERLERKIQEQYLAIKLEDKLSKEQILEYYLNTINLGQNTLGVQAASHRYFNKDVSELTLSEAAVIAGITKSPFYLNPIIAPEKNAERRLAILENMKKQGFISEEEYNEALADDVYSRIQLVNEEQNASVSTVNSYFVDAVIDQVSNDLQNQLKCSSTQAINMIYRGGLSIYTTLNPKLQKICDKVLADESLYPEDSVYELTYRLTTVAPDGEKKNYNELMMREYFRKSNPDFSLYFKNKKDADPYIAQYRDFVVGEKDTIEGEVISFTIQPQISFVLMQQSTGKVQAIVGGRGKKTASRTLNRATGSKRQPGSTFKILSTYLPALDTKGMTLASVQDDAPYYYPGTNKQVSNWDKRQYHGLTTLRQGIYNSMNVVTVKTLEAVTPQTAYSYLQKLGLSTLVERRSEEINGKTQIFSDINLPMALGGLTDGVYNLELTAAFAAIANGGVYTEPIFYTKIVDHDGKVLIDNTPSTSQVMKDSTAWLLTNAMEDVVTIGTGKAVNFQSIKMPLAGKTGTTSDDYDSWFVGYTPYYTAGIWGGYDSNKDQSSTAYTKNIWRIIMEKIHEKLKPKEFKKPNSVVSATICTKCGKLAVNGLCDNAVGGSCSRTEYFAKGTVPTENCDCHVKVKVCSSSNRQPSEFCPGNLIQEKVFLIKKETAATADTPNILPKNFENTICNVHSHAATPEPSEPPEEEPTDSPDTENPEPPEEEPANEPEVTQEPTEEPTAPPEDQPDDVEPPEET